MDRLHFSGLPESCRVGPANLLPTSTLRGRLRRCCVCKKVSVDYYLCASEHSYCPDCFPPSYLGRTWCVGCADYVEFNAERLPPSFMEATLFSCPCSFTGCLFEIRNHLLSTRNPEICFSQTTAVDRHRSGIAPHSQETLELLIRDFEQAQTSLRRHETVISMLAEGLSTMNIIVDILSRDQKILCFDLNKLSRRETLEYHKVVDGAPLKIQAFVVGLEDEPFLCVSVAGSDIEALNNRWPLEKCISLQILDVHGQPVVDYDILTFENGEYVDISFMDPTLDPSSPGVSFFVLLADVVQIYLRDGIKYMIMSASVRNLPI